MFRVSSFLSDGRQNAMIVYATTRASLDTTRTAPNAGAENRSLIGIHQMF